jgi:hypothetical protein
MHASGLACLEIVKAELMQQSMNQVECCFRLGQMSPFGGLPSGLFNIDYNIKTFGFFQGFAQIKTHDIRNYGLAQKFQVQSLHGFVVHDSDGDCRVSDFKLPQDFACKLLQLRYVDVATCRFTGKLNGNGAGFTVHGNYCAGFKDAGCIGGVSVSVCLG